MHPYLLYLRTWQISLISVICNLSGSRLDHLTRRSLRMRNCRLQWSWNLRLGFQTPKLEDSLTTLALVLLAQRVTHLKAYCHQRRLFSFVLCCDSYVGCKNDTKTIRYKYLLYTVYDHNNASLNLWARQLGTHHIDGQDVEAFTLPPPKVECDRLAVRRRHLGQVRTYGARMGGSLVLQTGLGIWYMV